MDVTYCTNVHPGESWPDVAAMLARDAAAVRDEAGANGATFPVGLRLAGRAAAALADPAERAALQALLRRERLSVNTLNGFPYGTFHGVPVKADVYAPDWAEPERAVYTDHLAQSLAAVLEAGAVGSISTLPVTYKPWAEPARVEAAAANLVAAAIRLERLSEAAGVDLTLALEPEPCCFLETTAETIAFFHDRLFSADAVAMAARETGRAREAAEAILRRRLSVCYDVCHSAVEFETPSEALAHLAGAGVRIAKMQVSSALRIPHADADARARLAAMDEPTYLHQVVIRQGDALHRFVDIPEALALGDQADGAEWRIHFHVPVFLGVVDGFATTQDALIDALRAQRAHGYADHVEVETYTWSVLPPEHQAEDLPAAIARELAWTAHVLAHA